MDSYLIFNKDSGKFLLFVQELKEAIDLDYWAWYTFNVVPTTPDFWFSASNKGTKAEDPKKLGTPFASRHNDCEIQVHEPKIWEKFLVLMAKEETPKIGSREKKQREAFEEQAKEDSSETKTIDNGV
jgi:hypothetical protein